MPRGRKVSPEYIPVIEWLNNKAEPGKLILWKNFPNEDLARKAMRRLRASLTAQVTLPPGRNLSVRRSIPANGKGIDVVVYVTDDPKGVHRLKQGQHT